MRCDNECLALNIPEHLHLCDRPTMSAFDPRESFYRRFAYDKADVTQSISFDSHKNSVNCASLCHSPQDALIRTKDGMLYQSMGVLCIRLESLHNRAWLDSDGTTYTTKFDHQPERCNYAHCNLLLLKDGIPIKSKAGALKMKIRESLRKELQIVHPLQFYGHTFTCVSSQPIKKLADPDATIPPDVMSLEWAYGLLARCRSKLLNWIQSL